MCLGVEQELPMVVDLDEVNGVRVECWYSCGSSSCVFESSTKLSSLQLCFLFNGKSL